MLALVFVDSLHLHIEQGAGIHQHAQFPVDVGRQPLLAQIADAPPAIEEGAVIGKGFEALQFGQVLAPALADGLIQQGAQGRVGYGQPAAGGHAIGDIGEALRPEPGHVGKQGFLDQFAVQFGHAIDVVAADNGQMGHAHPPLGAFLNQGNALQDVGLAGVAQPHHAQETGVDFVDDRQLARQQLLEDFHPPGFQGFRQQGVVGVADAGGGDAPGRIPIDAMLIHQQAHQLGHGNRRVGVVELNGELGVEVRDGQALALEDAEHVLQGAGHEEDLLTQPQPLALLELVIGIEHLREGFRLHLVEHSPGVIAGIEGGEIKFIGGLGGPEAQGVGGVNAVAQDRRVIGHAHHGLAANQHRIAPFRPDHFPGVALGQPGVGAFHLAFLGDLLAEDAEFVADAVADGRQLQAGEGFLEAGRQAPEATGAQARLWLFGNQVL